MSTEKQPNKVEATLNRAESLFMGGTSVDDVEGRYHLPPIVGRRSHLIAKARRIRARSLYEYNDYLIVKRYNDYPSNEDRRMRVNSVAKMLFYEGQTAEEINAICEESPTRNKGYIAIDKGQIGEGRGLIKKTFSRYLEREFDLDAQQQTTTNN